jgi:hypothetical protein
MSATAASSVDKKQLDNDKLRDLMQIFIRRDEVANAETPVEFLVNLRTYYARRLFDINPANVDACDFFLQIAKYIVELGEKIGIDEDNYNSTNATIESEIERNENLNHQRKHITGTMFEKQFFIRANNYARIMANSNPADWQSKPIKKLFYAINHNVKEYQKINRDKVIAKFNFMAL